MRYRFLGFAVVLVLLTFIVACRAAPPPTPTPRPAPPTPTPTSAPVMEATPTPTPRVLPVPTPPVVATPTPTPVVAVQPKRGGTLRLAPHADLAVLDPHWTTATITTNYAYMVFDTPLSLNDKLEVRPQMVDRWTISADSREYTFTLRDGLAFTDGTPVTSEEVVLSIQRWGKRDVLGKFLFTQVEKIETVDAKTFRIRLKEPLGIVLDALAKPASSAPFVLSKADASLPADERATATLGHGPFKLERREPGHMVSFVRNDAYKPRPEPPSGYGGGKVVYLDQVVWLVMPDRATQTAAVRTGAVDWLENPSHDDFPVLSKDPKLQIVVEPLGWQPWLRFNVLHPPFDNVLARRAVQVAGTQEDYLRAARGDPTFWRKCPSMFLCGGPWTTSAGSEELLKGDIEKGRRLLQEAGYDGRPILLMAPTDLPVLFNASLVTKALLEKIGAKVNFMATDWATVVARRAKRDPVEQGGWNIFHTEWPFPLLMDPVVHPGPTEWFGFYKNPAIDELRLKWARAIDPAERKRLAEEFQTLVYKEVPYVNLGQAFFYGAGSNRVKGVVGLTGAVVWWGVWIEK